MNKMLLIFILNLICLTFSPLMAKEGGSDKTGDGGIEIISQDGKEVTPVDAYEENQQEYLSDICDLPDEIKGLMPKEQWQKELNKFILNIAKKSLSLAHLIKKNTEQTVWFVLNLREDESIRATYDDGSVIEGRKINGAIRMDEEVYLDSRVVLKFWTSRNDKYPYQKILTRLLHEILLPSYIYPRRVKRPLGKLVVEVLRLAGYFSQEKGRPDYWLKDKKGVEFSKFFSKKGVQLGAYKFGLPTIPPEKEEIQKYTRKWHWTKKEVYYQSENFDAFLSAYQDFKTLREKSGPKTIKKSTTLNHHGTMWRGFSKDLAWAPNAIPQFFAITSDEGVLEGLDLLISAKDTSIYIPVVTILKDAKNTREGNFKKSIFKFPVEIKHWQELKEQFTNPKIKLCNI